MKKKKCKKLIQTRKEEIFLGDMSMYTNFAWRKIRIF